MIMGWRGKAPSFRFDMWMGQGWVFDSVVGRRRVWPCPGCWVSGFTTHWANGTPTWVRHWSDRMQWLIDVLPEIEQMMELDKSLAMMMSRYGGWIALISDWVVAWWWAEKWQQMAAPSSVWGSSLSSLEYLRETMDEVSATFSFFPEQLASALCD